MESQKQMLKKSLDKAFSNLGTMNSELMMDNLKYQDMAKGDVQEKWTEKYKKSIDCSNPKGFSQKAHCQGRKKKGENKEATGSGGGVGAFEAPVGFDKNSDFVKRSFAETPKIKKEETKEATTSASVGSYESPAMWAKSTKKKDWGPSKKTQIPGGSFVSVKKKCKKFPYCNQGDINALHIFKNESIKEAIKSVSQKLQISETVIMAILDYEYEKRNKERYL